MAIAIMILHAIVCILLIGIVLIQAGRGGGLVEGFSGVESMFGSRTSAFLTKATTVLSIIFFFTCISLALISARQGKSLLSNVKVPLKTTAAAAKQPAETGPVKIIKVTTPPAPTAAQPTTPNAQPTTPNVQPTTTEAQPATQNAQPVSQAK